MQLRHISPRSIDWVDAMDEGGGARGWDRLAPEELTKLRAEAQWMSAGGAEGAEQGRQGKEEQAGESADDDYGWRAGSASR